MTRKNDMMAFVTIEDLYGSIEMLVFPKTLRQLDGNLFAEENIVVITGRVSFSDEGEPKILCENAEPIGGKTVQSLYIRIPTRSGENSKIISDLLSQYKGSSPVVLKFADSGKAVRAPETLWVSISEQLINTLCDIFGKENIVVK